MKYIPYLILFLTTPALSQSVMDSKFQSLTRVENLPKNLRAGKTLVFLEVPGNNRSEWKRVTNSFHTTIMKGGIDPVLYYDIDLVFGGTDIIRSFMLDFRDREINNIILVDYKGENSRIAALDFSLDFFTTDVHEAFVLEGDFGRITDQLFVRTANSGLTLSNFLISETPEEGPLTNPIKGRRAEFFNLSMSAGKIAVPKFNDPIKDQELRAALELAYPYEYELVDPTLSDDEISGMGFLFILRHAQGPLGKLRKLLDYEEEDGVTGYVSIRYLGERSEAVSLKLEQEVHKYYIIHTSSNTTYLGSEWDADTTWRQGLLNHLRSMENQLND